MHVNIGTLLPRHAIYRPHQTAVLFQDHTLTFRQLNGRVNRLANALVQLGLHKGDKLATILPNCLEQLEIFWAVAKLGVVVVPLSPPAARRGPQPPAQRFRQRRRGHHGRICRRAG
jgi:long-chain acyl-CoA synthetase